MHESLRLYTLCKAMKWSHLPVAGGLYDQHPQFLDDMLLLMSEDAKAQEEDRRKRERDQMNQRNQPHSRGRGRR